MNLRVNELSRSGKETMVRHFDHKGLRQLQKRFDHEGLHQLQVCVTDENLRGQNVSPLSLYRYVKPH